MQKLKQLIGNKAFYGMVLGIAVPIMIQNGVTNFVSLLDNIMVGQLGTAQMSGVAIINQLIFVFNLCIFGGVSGAGIFAAQYWGQKNHEGMRYTFRFKIVICLLITLISMWILYAFRVPLIEFYLHDQDEKKLVLETLEYGQKYLMVMLIGLIPFAISQAYGSTLREMGETVIPMVASVVAVVVNMSLNYVLIFGKLGFPNLGIIGAAIATVISRFTECIIVMGWTHYHAQKYIFIQGVYKHFYVPQSLMKQIILKGTPLIINETLWAAGMAKLNQSYSYRGIGVVAALSISGTIANLFNVVFIALGSAISIIVGPLLGEGKMEEAKKTAHQMIFFSVVVCLGIGSIMALVAAQFPSIYKTTDDVKALATGFIRIGALCMPMYAFLHATYFTIRSGGKTVITFLFDSFYLWVVSIPIAALIVHFTSWHIFVVYLLCQMIDLIKCAIGYVMLKKEIWLQNLVAHEFE